MMFMTSMDKIMIAMDSLENINISIDSRAQIMISMDYIVKIMVYVDSMDHDCYGFLWENHGLYEIYGQNISPKKKNEFLIANKNSGFSDNQGLISFVKQLYVEYDIYDNYIKFFDKSFDKNNRSFYKSNSKSKSFYNKNLQTNKSFYNSN